MRNSSNIEHLKRYSNYVAWFTWVPIICIFIGCFSPLLFYFFNIQNIGLDSDNYSLFSSYVGFDTNTETLTWWQAALATCIDTLPIVILLYGFYQLRLQFICYAKAEYFTVNASNHCYNFGKALVAWVVLGVIFEPLLSLILTLNNEEKFINVSLTGDDIITFFPALCIMIIGRILLKASQIATENEQFI